MSVSGHILVLNAGSSSIKFALFDADLLPVHQGAVSGIGGNAVLEIDGKSNAHPAPDHQAALSAVLGALAARGITAATLRAAGHRVVHGGRDLTQTCRVAPDIEAQIEALVPLAPLHNPHNLAGIRALAALAPDLPQYAVFDTAFHAGQPEVALRYAIPEAEDAAGIRRYGFHGISYAALTQALPRISGAPLPRRLLALHLGNGASLCAIRDGHSVATTMGYSPLSGLTMGSRPGDIDAGAVLELARRHGIDGAAEMLRSESGLKGLGGVADMRALHQAGDRAARFAIGHFCYWAVRHAGSMIAAMDGLDALAFTGGIGENDAEVRARIMEGLGWLGLRFDPEANAAGASGLHSEGSPIGAWIVPAEEERMIARQVRAMTN